MTNHHQEIEHSFNDAYSDDEAMFGEPYQELQDYFTKLTPKGKVLDLWCGQGRDALFLASVGYKVTAVDSSSVGIKQMLMQAEDQGLKITDIATDILNMSLDEKFNVILFDMVLHGFEKEHQAKLLQKYSKNLDDGGFFCVVFPDDMNTAHFMTILNTSSKKWKLKDEIVVNDIPQVGDEVIDFTFVMQCIQHSC